MTQGWQLSDYLSSVSMVIRACRVMSDGHLLFGWKREQLGWSVSLCWCEKGLLIMIPGRVWVNHLLTGTYSGLHLKYAHMKTQTHMHTHSSALFLL